MVRKSKQKHQIALVEEHLFPSSKGLGKCNYKAGQLVTVDYRPAIKIKDNVSIIFPTLALKCIQWNIERGYKLDQIIEILKYHDGDIICLQELDVACERSCYRDCVEEIAQALQMKCAFLVEFEELYSPFRNIKTQGGGVHGNAIFSKFDFDAKIVPHTHHPIDWERQGIQLGEPRRGQRAIIQAEIKVPGMSIPIMVYSLHFEVYSGIFGRLKQYSDVTRIIHTTVKDRPYQLVFGDLNTMAHGVARLSHLYCRDEMRFGSLGYSEAAWWEAHVLCHTIKIGSVLQSFVPRCLNEIEAEELINPYLFDPFCVHRDTSLQEYGGLYQGKLDWTLVRGFRVLAKGMDNNDYRASDHKLLYVVLRPFPPPGTNDNDQDNGDIDPGKLAYKEFRQHHPRTRPTNHSWITIIMVMGAILILPWIQTLFR